MTLLSVFNVGVSGVQAQANKISSISGNISNVSTIGYKGFTTDFLSIVKGSNNPLFNSYNGAEKSVRQSNSKQGEITPSDRVTDIAVNGKGFFVVTENNISGSQLNYTRAGTFSADSDGNLRNSAGFYLQGWSLNPDSSVPAATQVANYGVGNLDLVNIAESDSNALATSFVNIRANLDASEPQYNPAGNINFTSNPTAGDTITINGVNWAFVASGATGNQTNIAPTLDETMNQLVADLNNDTAASNPLKTTGLITNPIVGDTININGVTRAFVASGATGNQTNIGANLDATLAQLSIDTGISLNPSLAQATYSNLNGTGLEVIYNAAPSFQMSLSQNPAAGDRITVNEVVWEFVASGAGDHQTNIGADLNATLTQWAADLNASTNPLLTTSTYANSGGTILSGTNLGNAASFSFSSSSTNGTTTSLLLYDSTVAASNITSGAIPENFNRLTEVIDNNGIEHTINIKFLKTAVNSWAVELNAVPLTDITTAGGQIASGTMSFNGDGSLASVSPSLTSPITFPWTSTGTIPAGFTTATVNNTVSFDWGTAGQPFGTVGATTIGGTDGMRQLSGIYQVDEFAQNGRAVGTLQTIEITDDGIVRGNYTNNTTQELFAIPLARFNNPDGLENIAGTAYIDSESSGFIDIFAVGQGGVGNILSGALENSNVDLSSQLIDIIVAQRAYQANTKTVSTSDEMLKTVSDMLR